MIPATMTTTTSVQFALSSGFMRRRGPIAIAPFHLDFKRATTSCRALQSFSFHHHETSIKKKKSSRFSLFSSPSRPFSSTRLFSYRGGDDTVQNPKNYSPLPQDDQEEEDFENTRIFMHNPEYGYRINPFAWKELYQICIVEKSLSKLSRSVIQQYEYQLYTRKIKYTYKTIIDHILCSKFHFEQRTDKETGLLYAHPTLSQVQKEMNPAYQIAVLPNEFPYYLADDVKHWVLWKLGSQPCTKDEIAEAKLAIQSKLHPVLVQDFIHWTNPLNLKSIPEIDHVHILCLIQKPSTHEIK